jgi:hypothetical protein
MSVVIYLLSLRETTELLDLQDVLLYIPFLSSECPFSESNSACRSTWA